MPASGIALSHPALSAPNATAEWRYGSDHSIALGLGFMIALMILCVPALVMDDRLLNGVSVWSKPLKFQASFAALLATLLWLLPQIEPTIRSGRLVRLSALTITVTSTLEVAYITLQAARGRASHFNISTQLEAVSYSLMGAGALILMIATSLIGLSLIRHPSVRASLGLRLGGGWGLILGAALTTLTAFVLGSGAIDGPGHWVGGVRSDQGGLLLSGWSRSGGDLRVPHFFATHLMQALPLLGLCLDRFLPGVVRPGILAGAIIGTAIVAFTFVQALSGQPFL